MAHRTRRGSCGPRNACTALTPLALLMALCVTVWSASNGLRAQPPQPTSPVTGPQPQPVPPTVPPPSPPPPMGFAGPGPGSSLQPPPQLVQLVQQPQRPPITIDPKTPLKDLLPTPPKIKTAARRGHAEDLGVRPGAGFPGRPREGPPAGRSRPEHGPHARRHQLPQRQEDRRVPASPARRSARPGRPALRHGRRLPNPRRAQPAIHPRGRVGSSGAANRGLGAGFQDRPARR